MSDFRVEPGIYVSDLHDGLVAIVGADDSVAVVADPTIAGPPQPAVVNYPAGDSRRLVERCWKAVPAKVVPLDSIDIRRAELPEVTVRLKEYRVNGHTFDMQTTEAEAAEYVLQAAALAEYLREHPPVDEAQVGALDSLIGELGQEYGYGRPLTLARRLVERGVRVGDA